MPNKDTTKADRTMKNYLYDNKDLQECKIKTCLDLNLDLEDDDNEIWMLQCPKSIDVNSLIDCKLGKSHQSFEFDAEMFDDRKTLMFINPEKSVREIHDKVHIIRPIGKITVSEKPQQLKEEDAESATTIVSKSIKREFDDHNNSTMRAEKSGNKRSKKSRDEESSPKKKSR